MLQFLPPINNNLSLRHTTLEAGVENIPRYYRNSGRSYMSCLAPTFMSGVSLDLFRLPRCPSICDPDRTKYETHHGFEMEHPINASNQCQRATGSCKCAGLQIPQSRLTRFCGVRNKQASDVDHRAQSGPESECLKLTPGHASPAFSLMRQAFMLSVAVLTLTLISEQRILN